MARGRGSASATDVADGRPIEGVGQRAEDLLVSGDPMVVTAGTIVSIRLTPAAYAHGLAVALPERLQWRARQDLNLRPSAPEADALSTELQARGPA